MRQSSPSKCAVTVIAPPGSRRADVRITGAVDDTAAPLLADAVRQLTEINPACVFVDLAEVSDAGSRLPGFLLDAYRRMPRSSSLVVCRPTSTTREILATTGILSLLIVRDHLLR